MPLLKRVWEAGKEAGATVFFTWSSVDMTAIAAYMKLGMLPGFQILLFEGSPQRIPSVCSGYEAVALEKLTAMRLDAEIRGTAREPDHNFWLDKAGLQGRQVIRNGDVVGYYYLGKGVIGPAAWKESRDGEAVMALACREVTETAPEIRLAVPGINHRAIRFALDSGLRLTSSAHLLATAPFGRLDQYLPSGPGLF